MSAEDERKAGAIAAAYALSMGTAAEAGRADAKAIAEDVTWNVTRQLRMASNGQRDQTSYRFVSLSADHLAGAAQFFRDLAAALDEQAAKLRGSS